MTPRVRLGRNAFDALFANGFGLVVSVLSVLLLPAVASVEVFGYWQLYLVYSSFVYLASFGLNDGVFLRYGGQSFEALDRPLLAGQFRVFAIAMCSLALLGCALAYLVDQASPIWLGVVLLVPILNLRSMLLYVMQASNRFRPYALCLIIDRGLFTVALVGILVAGPEVLLLVAADVICKALSLVAAILIAWPVLHERSAAPGNVRRELGRNVAAGSRLLIAGLAGIGVLGVIRLAIEWVWGIEIFGRISLLLSAAHLVMTFIAAFSQVLFPWLRTLSSSRLPEIYLIVRDSVALIGFGSMLAYWPAFAFITIALPEYSAALAFLVIVFPVIAFESKMSILVNAYSNTLRKERMLMWINLSGLVLSVLLSAVFGFHFKSLFWTVASMVIVQAFRAVVGELYLARQLGIRIGQYILVEIGLCVFFVIVMREFGPMLGSICFATILALYLAMRRTSYQRIWRVFSSRLEKPAVLKRSKVFREKRL